MPHIGAHLSVAGGFTNAVADAVALECAAVQIFTKSPNSWAAKPIPDADATAFKSAVKKAKLKAAVAHDSYLINLAAPNDTLYQKSIAAFVDEIERAEALGLKYLVTHPGAHVGSGEDAGLAKVAAALDVVHARCAGFAVKILIETTAGQGSSLGWKFEHLAYLLENVADPDRLGVCLDTCHVFAAGYALGTDAEYDATFAEFDRVVGLKQIRMFHVNDSEKPFGKRVDRHAALGRGHIGENAFRRLACDKRFRDRPMILETPKTDADGNPMDPANLALLRSFVGG